MKIISVEENFTQPLNPETGALEVSTPVVAPAKALELVFGEYSPNTQRAYARAFRDLQEWAGIRELRAMESFDPLRMLEYKNFLKSSGKKPATINQIMSALRKVCKVLTEFGYLKQNPFKASIIRAEKIDSSAGKGALQVSQLNAMIEANETLEYDGRVAPLLVLRHTKSGKEQRIKLRMELLEELEEWKRLLQQNNIETPYVFPSLGFRTLGRQMCGKGINDIVVRLGKAIGLNISAHYLRHTAITLALELGEPLQKVQSYARHASANTTIRYFHDRQLLEKNPTDTLPLI